MKETTYKVPGMSCEHCKRSINLSLEDLEGIKNVDIDLNAKTVKIEFDETKVTDENLRGAIEDAGYDIE